MTSRLDPTLEALLDAASSEATAQSAADQEAGRADRRTVWSLLGLDRKVASVASLPDPDLARIGELRLVEDEDTFYRLEEQEGVREWVKVDAPNGILFEFEELHGHFGRQECEQNYSREFSEDDGRIANMISAKLQSDVISGLERDSRSRHRTAMRSRLHAAAARQVAGSGSGTVNAIRRYLGNLNAEIDAEVITSDGLAPAAAQPGQFRKSTVEE